ncbi:uroporphyrinogen decarboxylase family protein [Planctomycetota bacterium]
MTPRQRILSVLNGEMPDRVPFTIKRPQPPMGGVERRLRNDGLAMCTDRMVFSTVRPNVDVFKHEYYENGRFCIRERFRTPVGEVSQLWIRGSGGYGSDKLAEYMIKTPEDYKVVEFIFNDEVYTRAYEQFTRAEEILGGDGFIFAGWMPPTPMMQMLWQLMGIEKFTMDQFDTPDIFFHLYEVLLECQCKQYDIIADSPALVAHIQENMTSDMIGLERFEKYVVPCYNKFASILHKKGKLLAAHFDGRMKVLAQALANSDIDIIEAFCPVPDGDMEMAEARKIWKDKIIWINFPTPVHLLSPAKIAAHVRKILREVAPGEKFLLGITEDIPDKIWEISLPIISKVLKGEAFLPLAIE